MTGYGTAEYSSQEMVVRVEIRAVNNRYCEVSLNLPFSRIALEQELKNLIRKTAQRGSIDVRISVLLTKPTKMPRLNVEQCRNVIKILEHIKKLANIQSELLIENITKFSEIISFEEIEADSNVDAVCIDTVNEALINLDKMRVFEGKTLEEPIIENLDKIYLLVQDIETRAKNNYSYWTTRFINRVKDLCAEGKEDRIAVEASIHAEKMDVSEELNRIRAHVKNFRKIMENESFCGKKLDFLCQELYREWNTLISKTVCIESKNEALEGKACVESIREQVQNVL